MYLTSTAVIMAEVVKLVISGALVLRQEGGLLQMFQEPKQLLRSSVPALLYLIQNNLQYVAVSNLQPATYQVVYQLKILTTAVLSVTFAAPFSRCHETSPGTAAASLGNPRQVGGTRDSDVGSDLNHGRLSCVSAHSPSVPAI